MIPVGLSTPAAQVAATATGGDDFDGPGGRYETTFTSGGGGDAGATGGGGGGWWPFGSS